MTLHLGGYITDSEYYQILPNGRKQSTKPTISLSGNTDVTIGIKTNGSDYIIGPFQIYYNSANTGYQTYAINYNMSNAIYGLNPCDENGNELTGSRKPKGACTFYLKVEKGRLESLGKINNVTVITDKVNYNYHLDQHIWGQKKYHPVISGDQNIAASSNSDIDLPPVDIPGSVQKPIQWTSFQGTMQIKKVDEFDGKDDLPEEVKDLSGIKLKVYKKNPFNTIGQNNNLYLQVDKYGNASFGSSDNASTFTVDIDGIAYTRVEGNTITEIVGLDPGVTYYVYEESMPENLEKYYNKPPYVLTYGTLGSGQFLKYKAKNRRTKTALQIIKEDEDHHRLNGVGFKIQAYEKNGTPKGYVSATKDNTTGRYKFTTIFKSLSTNAGQIYTTANTTLLDETKSDGVILIENIPLDPDTGYKESLYKFKIVEVKFETECYYDNVKYENVKYDDLYKINWDSGTPKTLPKTSPGYTGVTVTNKQVYGALTLIKRESYSKTLLSGFKFMIHAEKENGESVGWLKYDENYRCVGFYKYTGFVGTGISIPILDDIVGAKKINDSNTGVNKNIKTIIETSGVGGQTSTILKVPIVDDNGVRYRYDIYEVGITNYQDYFTLAKDGITEVYDSFSEPLNANYFKKVVEDQYITKRVLNSKPYDKSVITYATNVDVSSIPSGQKPYVQNEQAYINLEGYVWEDCIPIGGTAANRDYLYKERVGTQSKYDMKVEGIQVSLIYENGNVVERKGAAVPSSEKVQTAYTDANGAYKFKRVSLKELMANKYKIRFVYDGVTYENVLPFQDPAHINSALDGTEIKYANTSKVSETLRKSFNSKWTNIFGEKEITPTSSGIQENPQHIVNLKNESVQLYYDSNNYGLQVYNGNDNYNLCKRTVVDNHVKIEGTSERQKGKFLINADTKKSDLFNWYYTLRGGYKDKAKLFETIPNINLGIYQREMPNITLQKDTYKADVSINGKSYSYMYDEKLHTPTTTLEKSVAKLTGLYGEDFNGDYSLPIYESDVYYNDEENPSNNLDVTVTYKIKLQNASQNLITRINSINEYCSKDYELKGIYLSDSDSETVFNDSNKLSVYVNKYPSGKIIIPVNPSTTEGSAINDKYSSNVIFFKNPIELQPSSNTSGANIKYLYLQFRIKEINTDLRLENNTEIGNYSVAKKLTAKDPLSREVGQIVYYHPGVDSTSIPNNYNPLEYEDTDEDDSDRAPGVKIVSAGPRKISGIVFEDAPVIQDKLTGDDIQKYDKNNDGKIGAGEERIGDGIYGTANRLLSKDSNGNYIKDKPIQDVGVRLVDSNGDYAKIWDDTNQTWTSTGIIKTNNKGEFEISGFIPGDYKLQFEWGADSGGKDVRDYKGTICVNSNLINSSTGEIKESVTSLSDFENSSRESEATDDYIRRLAIDKDTLDLDDESLYSDLSEEEKAKMDSIKGDNLKKMVSSTPTFIAGVEKDGGNSGTSSEALVIKGTDSVYDMKHPTSNDKFSYEVKYIDFGLIERPRNSMGVEKRIKSIKLTTTEGRPVIIASIDVDGKVNAIAGESYISGGYTLGYLMAQIDKGIEESMNLEVEYEISVASASEIDYSSKEYYLMGTGRSDENKVKLTAEGLCDYAGGAVLMSDQNNWESIDTTNNSSENSIMQFIQIANNSSDMISTATEEEFINMVKSKGRKLTKDEISNYIKSKFDSYTQRQQETIVNIFDNWQEHISNAESLLELRKTKLDGRTIIRGTESNTLTKDPYVAGEPARTETIKLSKQLSPGENVDINNDVEIAKVTLSKTVKTARRVDMSAAPLYDRAEYVTVTPATGENRDYIGWTIVAIGILTVLGSGIVLIKRMLKK